MVHDSRTGRQWGVGTDIRPCNGFSTPAWSERSDRLAFTYAPFNGQQALGESVGCIGEGKPSGVVVVNARRSSKTRSWRIITARRGCQYTSVAFDHLGLAAFEACTPRGHNSPAEYFDGPDYAVQLTSTGKIAFRLPLKTRANPGVVLSDPRTDVVLVTQDQTYWQHRPTHEFVWQLQGRHLKMIAAYPFSGSGTFAAQPW